MGLGSMIFLKSKQTNVQFFFQGSDDSKEIIEETTIAIKTFNVLTAPPNCRKGQKFYEGRCRKII